MTAPTDKAPLWTPSPQRRSASRLQGYLERHGFADYAQAWEWSTSPATSGQFWQSIAGEFDVPWRRQPDADREPDDTRVPGVRWFRGSLCNYADMALRPPGSPDANAAVISCSQTRPPLNLSWAELRELTARIRAGLESAGVQPGQRVAAYLPNLPETLAALLATASLGAIWTSCAPEMGVAGVLDRFEQLDPTVLLAVDGYRYGNRDIDRRQEAEAIRRGLPSLRVAVQLPYLDAARPTPPGWTGWAELTSETAPLETVPVEFDHPLYILFSSGTTGKPKPIVHCHGGIMLEHAKALGLHFDAGPADRVFWFTTTGWMMWNFLVSGLLVDSAVVLYDGNAADLWRVMADTKTTVGGVGSPYLVSCMKAGTHPAATHDLTALRTLGATGSPLPAAAAEWTYREVAEDVMLGSFSGGTDVCTGFVGPSPLHPVWEGEISCRCLGAAVEVYDDAGKPVLDQEGELVLTEALPSMPVAFWGDEDGSRYRAAYFQRFPGVWAHGDRATLTSRGSVVITGRSDGTLNRGGVRMGTAEFYAVVEGFDEVDDSLVVHVDDPSGGPGELWLFVATSGPRKDLAHRLREALRRDLSPRHVPDHVEVVPAVPRTLSGKKLEVPVKRILAGVPVADALTLASVANPESLDPFVELAKGRP